MLHMVMFDQPLMCEKVDVFSVLSSLSTVNARCNEFLQDANMGHLVDVAKRVGNLRELSIPPLPNAWLNSNFKLNRVQIFNCLIFQ